MEYLFIVSCCGLFVAVITEAFTPIVRLVGSISSRNAIASNLILRMLVVNRFGAAIYFPSLAYLVDTGANYQTIAGMFVVTLLFAGSALGIGLLAFDRLTWMFLGILGGNNVMSHRAQENEREAHQQYTDEKQINHLAMYVANIFGVLGLTLPLLAASKYPDLRLTLAQLGFFFSSVFTVINAFYIDKWVTTLCDSKSPALEAAVKQIIKNKGLSFVISASLYVTIIACQP